jgi:hypothetical protein
VQLYSARRFWSTCCEFESTLGEKKSNPYGLTLIHWITFGLICGITSRNTYALLVIHCIPNGLDYWITQSQITVILSDYKWINKCL